MQAEHLLPKLSPGGPLMATISASTREHGHVLRVADWPYSMFHRHVREGTPTSDRSGSMRIEGLEYD
jgi:hypothetical protein